MKDEIMQVVKEALAEVVPREYLSVEEFGEYIGVSRPYAYQMVQGRNFPPCILMIGRRKMIIRKLWDTHAERLAKQRVAM